MIGPCRIESAEGTAISFQGELLVAVVSKPFAPGTPLRGTIRVDDADISIEGRATGSKRTADGSFEVRARVINLRKPDRERLEAASRRA